ncbi:MAG: hypothetical protein JW384_03876 [Nitrosomonadaceae bacterium]|nr:hypothetical protein [Nitrosomonadaceae bacterium]
MVLEKLDKRGGSRCIMGRGQGAWITYPSEAASYVTGTTLYADGAYLQNLVRYRPR